MIQDRNASLQEDINAFLSDLCRPPSPILIATSLEPFAGMTYILDPRDFPIGLPRKHILALMYVNVGTLELYQVCTPCTTTGTSKYQLMVGLMVQYAAMVWCGMYGTIAYLVVQEILCTTYNTRWCKIERSTIPRNTIKIQCIPMAVGDPVNHRR